jgi:hypothetical protein
MLTTMHTACCCVIAVAALLPTAVHAVDKGLPLHA